ncbi:MAG: kinase/pyrophosphorylase [Methylococcaceae bacterium]|nr:kinase/pyrophosphorylase [Methylococcaceae bacterium]MCI0734011.1 kinase/pyrophosphorylase [Methylococcaceae bacterium]
MRKANVFFISDHTAITVETLGYSVLTQFSSMEFEFRTIPFMNSPVKAESALEVINGSYHKTGTPPVVFSSITDSKLRSKIKESSGIVLDLFDLFIPALENALHEAPIRALGKSHSMTDGDRYGSRIEALNFALNSDDGVNFKDYERADLILVGVSRTGKTPTCLYLALQYGVFASNYPMTDEDLESIELPKPLRPHRNRIRGLTIDPNKLHLIRQERRPGSTYASLKQCHKETAAVEELFVRENIPFLDVTNFSIEEISTTILYEAGWQRSRI